MSIKTQDVAGDGLFGYLAQPEAAGKGAVLIVPTIFGVNAFARGFAETLAHAGLTAAVCDLYSGQPLPADYDAALAQARKLNDQIIDDIETRWLDHLQRGSAALGIIGFCLGGRCALIRAAQDRRMRFLERLDHIAQPDFRPQRLCRRDVPVLALDVIGRLAGPQLKDMVD